MLRLSIISINYNNLSGLEKTIESVFAQGFTDYEYIIIDGGSTDGSKELIEKNGSRFAFWVSEKDKGIFNAMNKGIQHAKGEYLIFLNSGDYFYAGDVLADVFSGNRTEDIIYGNVIWQPVAYNGNYPDQLTFEHFINNTIPHQGAFIRRTLFDYVGLYEEQYEVNSDWNFFILAIYKYNCSYIHLNLIISFCNTEGVSLKPESISKVRNLRRDFIQQHFAAFHADLQLMGEIRKELASVKKSKGYRIEAKFKKLRDRYLPFIK